MKPGGLAFLILCTAAFDARSQEAPAAPPAGAAPAPAAPAPAAPAPAAPSPAASVPPPAAEPTPAPPAEEAAPSAPGVGLGLPGADAQGPTTTPLVEPPLTPGAAAAPAAATPAPKLPPGPATPVKVETANSSFRFGVLLQGQYEALGSPTLDGMSNNLFLRRARLLFGGTLFDTLEFFVDTDYPDLFKAAPDTGAKNTPGLNIQDAYFSVKALGDQLKVDIGYMLPPLSHNAVQGATSLYGWDYFANTFRHNLAFGSSANPVGRDLGLQLRGLLADGLVEYRVGLFQGRREAATMTEVASQNFFRPAARIQLNLLDPEPSFFYAGTYFGAKQILSFGASYDFQDSYRHWSFDGFLDIEVGPGVLTAQANVVQWDGDDWIESLPEQTALMAEAGYLVYRARISPILRFEKRWVPDAVATNPEELRLGAGIAFWPYGHNFNLKAFYTRIEPDAPGATFDAYNQFNLQAQLFIF